MIAFGGLIASAFLPQEQIDLHVAESADVMVVEGTYPVTGDRTDGSILDNFTDALILMESKALKKGSLSASLTNPKYMSSEDPVESLYNYVYEGEAQAPSFYYRYWMGFRTIIRLVQVFMNYYSFKRYLALGLFFLFALLVCRISRHTNSKIAMSFAVSVILVRPDVICNSIQYSTCFFIAFLAMLMVPWVYNHPKFEKLFFMEIGIITMYFDFYTVPILTFGLPMTYLYLLRAFRGEQPSVREIFTDVLFWFVAYVFMWIAKLTLVTVMTSLNGFENSILLPLHNSNLAHLSEVNIVETIISAYKKVFSTLAPHTVDKILLYGAGGIWALLRVWKAHSAMRSNVDYRRYANIFVIALFPMIWYAASNRALQNHYYFQNRSIVVIIWVVMAYFILLTDVKARESTQTRGN